MQQQVATRNDLARKNRYARLRLMMSLILACGSLGLTLGVMPVNGFAEDRPFVVIHRQGENDCHTFRIPAITVTNQGTLLAVYDMRYRSRRDLQGHMDIGLSRSTDGGKTWEPPRPIMDMGTYGGLPEDQNGCSDPNILVDKETGDIWVCAVWTHGKPGTH
ncbi:MAG: sialidase family protein, partial [Planctomycetota bacterium]|nr:sialidase family protein [Planctomycetota bacterium]